MMASKRNGTLYIGVTSDLVRRCCRRHRPDFRLYGNDERRALRFCD
ncbi:MAG: hypothetical protein ACKVKG_06030 [Alphaproteobacteria bacterium]